MNLLKAGKSYGVEFYQANVAFQSVIARRSSFYVHTRAPMAVGLYENSLNASEADLTSRLSKRCIKGRYSIKQYHVISGIKFARQ